MSDPVRMILRGLAAALNDGIELVEERSTDWASITFAGGRHHLRLRAWVDPARLLATIGDIDFPPRDHLVADILAGTVEAAHDSWLFDVEVLTVEV